MKRLILAGKAFGWDADKEDANIRKHSVSFSDACKVFLDPNKLARIDFKHSAQE